MEFEWNIFPGFDTLQRSSGIKGQNSVDKEFLEIVGNKKPTGSVLKVTIVVSATIWISVWKIAPSNPSPTSFMQQSERKSSRNRSPRGRSPSGKTPRWPCKDYLRGTCNNSFCKRWHPPECLFYKNKNGCRFGVKCSFAHRQVDEQPTKRSKSNNGKSAVALLKKGDWHERESVTDQCHDRSGKLDKRSDKKLGRNSSKRQSSDARQLGFVFHKTWSRRSLFSLNWKQLVEKNIHGNVSCRLVNKESSIFNAQRSTSFHILYCVLVRFPRTFQSNTAWEDRSGWFKVLQNTEIFTESKVSQWNSSGIFSQDSTRSISVTKSKVYCWN